jgi:hypothetical protein
MKHITFGHPVGIQRFYEILRVAFDSDGSGFVNGFFGYFLNCNINLGKILKKKVIFELQLQLCIILKFLTARSSKRSKE